MYILQKNPGEPMILIRLTLIVAGATLFVGTAEARDSRGMYSYSDAISTPAAKAQLGDDVTFHFGPKKPVDIAKDFGEFATNKKTNAFNKSDTEACQWVFLSALIALRDQARKQGANAVVEIRSNYKNHLIDSETEFECGAGALMAGVALKGRVVNLKKK
jgi:uncharacterized protein YbjQ (UPF0145 family)